MKNKVKKIITMIIILLLVITLLLVVILKKNKNNTLVYLSNGRLYSLKDKKVKELGRGELSSVKFFDNNKNKYLYKIENDLLLYDKEPKKILENAKEYFIKKDSFVITDINNKLYLYDKELKELEENITTMYNSPDDLIIYSIKQKVYSYNLKDGSKKEICSQCPWITTSKENSFFIYINNKNSLIKKDIDSDKEDQIAENVTSYKTNDSLDKILYIDNHNTLYYLDNKKSKEVTDKVQSIQFTDYENDAIAFTREGNESYLYLNGKNIEFDKKSNVLQIIKGEKELYILTDKGKIINYNPKTEKLDTFADKVYSKMHLTKKGFVYEQYDDSNNENVLYLVENGKSNEICKGIVNDSIEVNRKENIIYYLKKDKENSNILYSYNKKETKIDDKVYKYYVLENKEIYYIKNYKAAYEYGDLYKFNKKAEMIQEKVSDVVGFNGIKER